MVLAKAVYIILDVEPRQWHEDCHEAAVRTLYMRSSVVEQYVGVPQNSFNRQMTRTVKEYQIYHSECF